MSRQFLSSIAYNCILDLASKEGIYASSKQEAYGCVFGRDTAITVLKLLNSYTHDQNRQILSISKNALETLIKLQGKGFNVESGEEPGKCIHEYREKDYERLINSQKPWYLYPDKKLRNYDSIDATPLMLIAVYRYWQLTNDTEFFLNAHPSVEAGLNWIMNYGDKDRDFLIEYELTKERRCGGLTVQSWTDSGECLLQPDKTFPVYPIAAVEVQAFAWLALKLWSDVYQKHSTTFSQRLKDYASSMKKSFNKHFIIEDSGHFYAAQALDGNKNQIRTVTANPLLCLWATYKNDGSQESIVEEIYVPHFVDRAFHEDMFLSDAGIRTMSALAPTYNPTPTSYHNGSFWPILNGLIHEGLITWKYYIEAELLAKASLKPILEFKCPIELYIKDSNGALAEYTSPSGHKGCRFQAWTAAAILDLIKDYKEEG
ncbi:MAG: amylo-alpha-1,6-glucosidase [Patescibacteria group bacterium]|jgi:glycogen debranching enzyme